MGTPYQQPDFEHCSFLAGCSCDNGLFQVQSLNVAASAAVILAEAVSWVLFLDPTDAQEFSKQTIGCKHCELFSGFLLICHSEIYMNVKRMLPLGVLNPRAFDASGPWWIALMCHMI